MTEREIMEQVLQKVTNMETELKSVRTDVSSLQTDVRTLQTDVKTLQTDVKTLQTDVKTLQTDVKTLQTDVSELKDNQGQIRQAVLETNETTKRMDNSQVKHEHILDLLSKRSIEQEAELNRINSSIS